ncbi:MAG: TonB-dependent receptor [Saprospiraceae bacterium]|nr:TonB-dependent receptor [Saprospiraceae bacterium]
MIKRVQHTIWVFFLMATSALVAQEKMSLDHFVEHLSKKYKIEVAIDPALLKEYQIDAQGLDENNVVESLAPIFIKSGLDFYQLNNNQILLRKSIQEDNKLQQMVSGKILDSSTQQPLPFAAIYTTDLTIGTTSNESGMFVLKVNNSASDSIEFSYLGYKKIRLSMEECKRGNIFLQAQRHTFDNVIIVASGNHFLTGMASYYQSNYQNYKYSVNPAIDIHRNIQKLPGVSKSDNATIGIRGQGSDKTLTMVENIPVLNAGHYYNLISGLNELYFDEFVLFKNQYPSSFGNALGGMVQFLSKPQSNYKLRTTSNLLYSGLATDLRPLPSLSIKAAGRISYLDINQKGILASNFNQLKFETNNNSTNGIVAKMPNASFYDANMQIRWAYNKNSYIEINGLLSNDNTLLDWLNNRQFFIQNQSVILTQTFSNFRELTNTGLSVKHKAALTEKINLVTDVYAYRFLDSFHLSNTNIDYFNGSENTIRTDYVHRQNVGLNGIKSALQILFSDNINLNTGLDFAQMEVQLNTSENTNTPLLLDQNGSQLAFFSDLLYQNQKWNFAAGIRVNRPSGFNDFYLQPQLSASYKVVPGLEVKSSISRRVQNFNQFDFETRFAQNLKYYYISEKDFLPLQYNTSCMVGARFSRSQFMLDVEFWQNQSSGSQLFTTLVNGVKPGGPPAPPMYTFFNGETLVKGVDVAAAYSTASLKYSLAYTLSKATQKFDGIYRNLIVPSPDDRRHQLTVGCDYKKKQWTLNTSLSYLSGVPYLSFEKSRDKGPKDKASRQEIIAYLTPYFSWDAGANYEVDFNKWKINFGISVANLTNHTNVKFLQQTGEFDDKKNMQPMITGNQALMLGRFFNLHIGTRF